LQAAVRSVVGTVPGIEIVVARDWLRDNRSFAPSEDEGNEAVAGD